MQDSNDSKTAEFAVITAGTAIGHYRAIKRIGIGGMGEVYLARDESLHREVALKFLLPSFVDDHTYRVRFAREAHNVARLNHPNVVTIYEVGEHQGRPYLAMEHVAGATLKQLIAKAALSLEDIVSYAIQIAEALIQAHAHQIIHRDLKPENIKLSHAGRLKILDFGLARSMATDTVGEGGTIAGTVHYMSPEQVSGSELSCSTDLFSFGIVLYQMCTGQLPFKGDNPAAVMYSILHEMPLSPRKHRPDLPEWLEAMILKLLEKDPGDRFDSAADLLAYLKESQREGISATTLGPLKTRKQSVTVIDLRNLSGDNSWDYFCKGFSEDLLREIARRTNLVVSAKPEGDYARDISEVFRRCRSDYVATGSLMKLEARLRLTLNVFGDKGSKLVFGEEYQGLSEQLFDILSQAAKGAADALANATGMASVNVSDMHAADVTAYEFYLKGRNYYQTNKPEGLAFAEQMFTKALQIDPSFALPHAGLADVHAFQYMAYYDRSPERLQRAKQEALIALEKQPGLPEALRSLGRCYMFAGDLKSAESTLLKVVETSPKYAIGYRTLAWFEYNRGNCESALTWAKKSLEFAPTDLETHLLLGLIYLNQRKYTLSLSTLLRAIELGPDYGRAYYLLGQVYMKLGVLDLALENLNLATKYEGDPNSLAEAGYVHLLKGELELAEGRFRESIEKKHFPFMAYYYLGMVETAREKSEAARYNFAKSLTSSEEFLEKDEGNCHILSYKAMALAAIDRRDEAKSELSALEKKCENQGEILYNIARAWALLGDQTKSSEYSRAAVQAHAGPSERELAYDPHFLSHQ